MDGTHFSPKSKTGERKYLTSKNVTNVGLDLSDLQYISEAEHRVICARTPVRLGDVLLTKDGASTGNCCLNTLQEEFSLLSSVAILRTRGEAFNNMFLLQNLRSVYGSRAIQTAIAGQAITRITLDKIKELRLRFPSLLEQEKIAGFLSALDEKIVWLARKKELLQQYRTGAIQKIFDQEIRVNDETGATFPPWTEKSLREYLVESRVPGSKGNIAKKLTVKLWGKGVYEKDVKRVGSQSTQYYKRRAGQLIYSKLDFLNCAFGIIPEALDGYESTVDLPCFDISSAINRQFLLLTVTRKRFYLRNGMTADGSRKARRVHADTFLDFVVNIPTLSEQDKIVNFVRLLDHKIELVGQQLIWTKEFKKGLLRRMFV